MKRLGLRFFKEGIAALRLAVQHELTYRASALTFTTLLSLVPIITVCVYLMRNFYAFLEFNELAKAYIVNNFVPNSSQAVIAYLDTFSLQASELPILSILFLFVTSILLLITIGTSLNTILHLKEYKRHPLWFVAYPLIVFLFPIFIGFVALLSSFLVFLFDQLPLIKALTFVVPLLVNSLLFTLLYLTASAGKIKTSAIFYGGFIAALLLELAKVLFVIYLDNVTTYQAIYGALAAIPIFFVWLYIFWFILLFGACLIKARVSLTDKG